MLLLLGLFKMFSSVSAGHVVCMRWINRSGDIAAVQVEDAKCFIKKWLLKTVFFYHVIELPVCLNFFLYSLRC